MIQQIDINLRQLVPYYASAMDLSTSTLKCGTETASSMINQVSSQINKSKQIARKVKDEMQNNMLNLIELASNELLTRAETILMTKQQRPTESDKKQMKKRFQRVINKIINDYVLFYAEQAKQFHMVLVKQGKQYFYANLFPMYIKLKATILVSKEIILEMLENRLDDMRMTYSVSKDNVTMLIRGKFEEDKIIGRINEGMENFKSLTVKVVKKGLQIKVDKASLYQNYETFSLKLLEIIKEMRQKGAQRIVSAKQRTTQLYQNVINRIREKQITLRMEYKQLEDTAEQTY